MIYFGWDGLGPWNSGAGSIWFLLGIMVGLWGPIAKDRTDLNHRPIFFTTALFLSGLGLGGYYGWFAGVVAQAQKCWHQ